MALADNILRALTSSSNEKFDGALQILDIITQLVADRLGASLCATLYRKAEGDRYRLLAIEDSVGIPTDRLPEFERFVNDNVSCDGFVGRYLDLRHDSAVNRANAETLERSGVQILYAYQFTPGEADSALIIACISDTEQTGVLSADRVCRLAAQQMRVVFSFVELEIKERALKAFMRVILRLSALSFEGADLEETVGRIAPLGLELPGVRQVRLISRESEPELYDSALQEIDQRELAEGDEETTVVGSVLAAGAGLRCGLSGAGEYLSALERGTRPRWLLLFVPNEFSGFDVPSLELLHLFASYAAITVSNHNLALRQKRVNDDLRAAQDRLVEAESLAALGDMASGLAHDFNNMLGAIIGKLQVLQLQADDNDLRRRLRDIEELAGDGAERIRRLQEFAISAAPASLKPLDLCELYRRYQTGEHSWRDAAREKSITVRFEPPALPEAIIAGKEKDIYLLLDSVIANAVDVTGADGAVVVTLTLEAGRAALRVRDSGPGIPDTIKNKIFNPFFTTKKDRGAGLGLSVAHSIAVRHGGSISAQSTAGAIGATFSTSFPLVNSQPADTPAENPERAPRPLRIMVVDDDAQIRDVLSDMLTLLDQDSELYEDGPSALAAFSPGKYDLVITDLGMPGMSGMELTSELRDLEPELPIAMVTGWGAQLDPAEMTEKGICRVISKPFYLKDIRDLVTHLPEATV